MSEFKLEKEILSNLFELAKEKGLLWEISNVFRDELKRREEIKDTISYIDKILVEEDYWGGEDKHLKTIKKKLGGVITNAKAKTT